MNGCVVVSGYMHPVKVYSDLSKHKYIHMPPSRSVINHNRGDIPTHENCGAGLVGKVARSGHQLRRWQVATGRGSSDQVQMYRVEKVEKGYPDITILNPIYHITKSLPPLGVPSSLSTRAPIMKEPVALSIVSYLPGYRTFCSSDLS